MKILLLTSVLIAVVSTRSAIEIKYGEKSWWETALFYQIYPRSFLDTGAGAGSRAPGTGDLKGVIAKLPYLRETGIDATWLSPIFTSPQKDFGYDISNFKDVDPLFGTMADIEELFKKANETGIKVILDFVPNHTSDQHEWFQKSIKKDPVYSNYYIWHPGKLVAGQTRPNLPNNWKSVFRGSAWEWNDVRKEYYLHQFAKEQPDLNFRNPKVVDELTDVLIFWMKKGASGFRVDAINHMFEFADFRDEPINEDDIDEESYGRTLKHYTKDLDETYDIIALWRKELDKFATANKLDTIVMMTEAYANLSCTLKYYGSDDGLIPRAHFPFNFLMLGELNEKSSAFDFKLHIDRWIENLPRWGVPNWVLGNHDQPRVGSRYGKERIDQMLVMLLTLPGVAVTYMGEEIGMIDHRDITWEETRDPQGINAGPENYKWASRDPARTPFQWDDTHNAGFSPNKTWLPVHPYYRQNNLLKQNNTQFSHYKLYQELSTLRKNRLFREGDFKSRAFSRDVFGFVRYIKNDDARRNEEAVVLINFSDQPTNVNIHELFEIKDGSEILVVGTDSRWKLGQRLQINEVSNFRLGRYDSVVIGYSATASITASLGLIIISVLSFLLF